MSLKNLLERGKLGKCKNGKIKKHLILRFVLPIKSVNIFRLKVVNEAQQRKEKSEPKVTDLLAFRLLNKQWKALVDKMLKKEFKRDCLDFMVVVGFLESKFCLFEIF